MTKAINYTFCKIYINIHLFIYDYVFTLSRLVLWSLWEEPDTLSLYQLSVVRAVRFRAGCIYFCASRVRSDNMENPSERRKTSGDMGQGGRFQVPLTTHKQPQLWALSKRRYSTRSARARSVCASACIGSEESDKKTPLCDLFSHCFAFVGLSGGALKRLLVSDWMSGKWE